MSISDLVAYVLDHDAPYSFIANLHQSKTVTNDSKSIHTSHATLVGEDERMQRRCFMWREVYGTIERDCLIATASTHR